MKTVEIFFYPGAAGLDVMGPLEVFAAANQLRQQAGAPPAYKITLSAPEAGLIGLSSGAHLQASTALGEPHIGRNNGNQTDHASDYFIIAGGLEAERLSANQDIVQRLLARAERSYHIVSICTGAFLLAATGLLEGKSCSTHWRYAERLAKCYPAINVQVDKIFIRDGNILTSAGVTAGIDLCLALVEQDYGAEAALEVARNLLLYLRRPGGQSQFSAPLSAQIQAGDTFSALYNWLHTRLSEPLQVDDMAAFCHMSPRHFARRFSEQTGSTPAKYLEQLRITRARELLEASSHSIDLIAQTVGFGREERLRRAFVKSMGVTPSVYRSHFNCSSNQNG